MIELNFPFTQEKIAALKVGDAVEISGVIFTGRDAVHKYLHEGGELPPGVNLQNGIIYHCGPVMMQGQPLPFAKSRIRAKSSNILDCAV